MKKLIALFTFLTAASAAFATVERIQAEFFDSWGGWVNDTQFMDSYHSSYLLAHGMGKPVANAKTSFTLTKACEITVSCRTKNWTAPWSEHAAGTFQVLVDGAALPKVLGTQGKGEWVTEPAGTVKLAKGKHTLELQDLTGFDGRCDWVELEYAAPADPTSVRTVSNKEHHADLVVVGGGIAGISAAISAARLGLKVALVQDRPVLGGNNSSEVRVHLGGWQNMPPYPRLGDTIAEFGPARGGNARPIGVYEDDRKLAVVKAEKNIALFLNTRVDGVTTNETGRIVSVTGQHTQKPETTTFYGRWFVDATGDGTVGFLAGADWREGREAKSETGEAWAPEEADMLTMGASVQWYADKTADGKDVDFPQQPWMIRFNDANGHQGLRGDWNWEAGLGREQIAEAEHIRDYGLLVAFSNWGYVKNIASNRTEYANKELKWVAYIAGRRESRRLMGDWVLSENDIDARTNFPDATCVATWTIDLHFPKAAEKTKFTGEPFQTDSLNKTIWPIAIPYRCYYSRNVPNLFMAGRDISVTHIALGTTRLMRTHGMMGEVVGMAASLCKKYDCDPRGVYAQHLEELKTLMTKGVGDGKVHPPQMYNQQRSLDPDFNRRDNEANHQLR